MRGLTRRLAISMLAATVAALALASPAQAATNPFTAAQACNNDFGGAWAYASDGHRSITALMYNSATAYNCVVTLKRVAVGSTTGVSAGIRVEGGSWAYDSGSHKYRATIQRNARDTGTGQRRPARPGHPCDVAVRRGGALVIEVRDDGVGIAAGRAASGSIRCGNGPPNWAASARSWTGCRGNADPGAPAVAAGVRPRRVGGGAGAGSAGRRAGRAGHRRADGLTR